MDLNENENENENELEPVDPMAELPQGDTAIPAEAIPVAPQYTFAISYQHSRKKGERMNVGTVTMTLQVDTIDTLDILRAVMAKLQNMIGAKEGEGVAITFILPLEG